MATRERKAPSEVPSVKTRTTISKMSKQQRMIEMLRRSEGATIAQLGEAFGWQAHTVRGAISGALKKNLGLQVVSDKPEGGERVYRIAYAANELVARREQYIHFRNAAIAQEDAAIREAAVALRRDFEAKF
ncbi:MAG TPA: DUF3489 domain-containing protein [Stellaceae bacterium]|nr:DUF3489 domain-containing protein [Stellaceae bacterium]